MPPRNLPGPERAGTGSWARLWSGCAPSGRPIGRAALFAQGGEFAFVLYSAAATAGVIDAQASAALTAIVILSMALTPLTTLALKRFLPKEAGLSPEEAEGVDAAEVAKVRRPVQFIAVHIKARYHAQVVQELRALGLPNLEIGQLGKPYVF